MSKDEKQSDEAADAAEGLSEEQLEKVSGGFIIQVREQPHETVRTETVPTDSFIGNPDELPSPVKK